MGRRAIVSSCVLNQFALDFQGNYEKILISIIEAKAQGARFRTGPELEICGYSCEDHFYESDTLLHSWQVLAELLKDPQTRDILVDVGMPVMHRNVSYNCRVIFLNGKILLIRPKRILCDDGIYRETRWFTAWTKDNTLTDFHLPRMITAITEQTTVPFGDGVISTADTCIGFEICEELWNPESSHIALGLDGVEIISNSSGSYIELRKSYYHVELIKNATAKSGGCYLFSNFRGCDGQRIYFNQPALVAFNGQILAKTKQYALEEVEVCTAIIDLEEIRSYRNQSRSRCIRAEKSKPFPRVRVNYSLSDEDDFYLRPTSPIEWNYLTDVQEITWGPACWLWDYLRRSGQSGFFLPLSGGLDSSSVACIVSAMCHIVYQTLNQGDETVLRDLRRIVSDPTFVPKNASDICHRILFTCYMGSSNSSEATKTRAGRLAKDIGSNHHDLLIDRAVTAFLDIFRASTGLTPQFKAHGGTHTENLALQNLQARIRMVMSYLYAQLMRWATGLPGSLLVLGTANVDEALRGYMTKYDCSSADINPIGSISKGDLTRFLKYFRTEFDHASLDDILCAPPTAELEPLAEGGVIAQTDEVDMGMTYAELGVYGRLRKPGACGPYSMFCKLVHEWRNLHPPELVAEKVKHFFRSYAINRHKMTVLTPAYHTEVYSPDDNRHDHRPFLYNVAWTWQFRCIDEKHSHITTTKPHQMSEGDGKKREGSGGKKGVEGADAPKKEEKKEGASGSTGKKGDTPTPTPPPQKSLKGTFFLIFLGLLWLAYVIQVALMKELMAKVESGRKD
ncbi:unnamed protein product [Cyprideis torosa]|uniref:Glutamine-dependent NAD(+) synthetase n=2 Tax=Cyprideis torosa TaxID=163714 RepID=A0A7R8ZL48_9CRUS|nr:unnamed protein product [Cyprideis torosa]CAG0885843.1 unnamed protein product [Cyprideis torosa]